MHECSSCGVEVGTSGSQTRRRHTVGVVILSIHWMQDLEGGEIHCYLRINKKKLPPLQF